MRIDLGRVKSTVDLHLREFKSIDSVADHMLVSRETLRKRFLRDERVSLSEYINRRKIAAMKEYLILTDVPCYFVCYMYGYREDSGAKIFKKMTGMTMAQFREKYRRSKGYLATRRSARLTKTLFV